jgi:hypothetical protein
VAACTLGVVVHTTASSNAGSLTGAFTPVAGDLLLCVWAAAGTSGTDQTCTSTGNTGSWTLLDEVTFTTAGNNGRIWAWAYSVPATATSTTVQCSLTVDGSTGQHIWVYQVSGMSRFGLAAKRQACEDNSHAAGTPAATAFAAACLTTNPVLSFVHDEGVAVGYTPPTSWTEPSSPASEGIITVPTSRGVSAFIDSGFTGTAITWGTASTGVYGHYGIELDASALPGGAVRPNLPLIQNVNHRSPI